MPVLILGRPNLGFESGRADLRIGLDMNALLEEPPCSVYDLCACFDLQLFAGLGTLVDRKANIHWSFPYEFPCHFHSLLAVTNIIMKHAVDLGLKGFGSICAR